MGIFTKTRAVICPNMTAMLAPFICALQALETAEKFYHFPCRCNLKKQKSYGLLYNKVQGIIQHSQRSL